MNHSNYHGQCQVTQASDKILTTSYPAFGVIGEKFNAFKVTYNNFKSNE